MALRRHYVGITPEIEDVGTVPGRPNLYEHLKNRIMEAVKDGSGTGYDHNTDVVPGIAAWAGLRHRLGGRYRTADVQTVIDDLLRQGAILEAWWHDGSRRIEPKHWILLPECIEQLPGIHRIRGRLDLVPEHIIDALDN